MMTAPDSEPTSGHPYWAITERAVDDLVRRRFGGSWSHAVQHYDSQGGLTRMLGDAGVGQAASSWLRALQRASALDDRPELIAATSREQLRETTLQANRQTFNAVLKLLKEGHKIMGA